MLLLAVAGRKVGAYIQKITDVPPSDVTQMFPEKAK